MVSASISINTLQLQTGGQGLSIAFSFTDLQWSEHCTVAAGCKSPWPIQFMTQCFRVPLPCLREVSKCRRTHRAVELVQSAHLLWWRPVVNLLLVNCPDVSLRSVRGGSLHLSFCSGQNVQPICVVRNESRYQIYIQRFQSLCWLVLKNESMVDFGWASLRIVCII
jgi:hypothetical protein